MTLVGMWTGQVVGKINTGAALARRSFPPVVFLSISALPSA